MVGRRSHCGPVGLGLENPCEPVFSGLYQGQEDKAEECAYSTLEAGLGQSWGRPGPAQMDLLIIHTWPGGM